MRTAHLFAGAGGGLYADLILNHSPVFAVELDAYAAGVLQRRVDDGWFPGLQVFNEDVQLFDSSCWAGRVDSLHAGFPCQDISVAGGGAGLEGERSGLWSEVVRIADELGVPELFLENSPAITSRGLGVVLGDLAQLGFDARWCVLPAAGVGAPHVRARWWCLARRTNGDGMRELQSKGSLADQWRRPGDVCAALANTNGIGQQGGQCGLADQEGRQESGERSAGPCGESIGWWSVEPGVGRVADGVAHRGNRIKCLGNGQVPLQAAAAYVMLSAGFENVSG